MVTLVLCSCNNSGTSSNTTTQAENTVSYEAFVKDDVMYIRDDKGNAYEYNDGIYTDDDTGEEYIYVNSLNTFGGKVDEIRKEYNLTADVTDMDKRMEEINKLDEKIQNAKVIEFLYLFYILIPMQINIILRQMFLATKIITLKTVFTHTSIMMTLKTLIIFLPKTVQE